MVGRRATRWVRGIPILIAVSGALVATTISARACGVFSQIVLNPTSGPPGATIMVAGGGFAPPPGGSVDISLGTTGPILASVDATEFSVPVTIPSSTPPGVIAIAATDHTGSIGYVTATFQVTAPPQPAPAPGPSSGPPASSPPAPAPSAPGSAGPGSSTPVLPTSGAPGVGAPAGAGGGASVVTGGLPPSGAGSVATYGPGGLDKSGLPIDGSGAVGSLDASASPVSRPLLSGTGTVFGTAGNGFRATAISGALPNLTPGPLPGSAPVPALILVATLVPVLLAAAGVLTVRRRRATRRA